MKVAVWDHLPFELFADRSRDLTPGVEFVRTPESEAASALAAGEVDVALVPVLTVLQNPGAYDVLPAVGLSTWDFPFARLLLRGGLDKRAGSLVFEQGFELEALVARVVLREHYASDVEVRAVDDH